VDTALGIVIVQVAVQYDHGAYMTAADVHYLLVHTVHASPHTLAIVTVYTS